MKRYTPERGYGLDLSGPEPMWRGRMPRWNWHFAFNGYMVQYGYGQGPSFPDEVMFLRDDLRTFIPRYRVDEYIKRGLIDPARRDDL